MGNRSILKTRFIIILTLAAGLILTGCGKTEGLKKVLTELDVAIDLDGTYGVTQDRKIIDDSRIIRIIHAASQDNIIKIRLIKDVSAKKATDIVKSQGYLINSLFGKQQTPYPGPLTKVSGCPRRYLPVVEEEDDGRCSKIFYYMYANDRLVFGGHDEESLKYAMILAFIYCREKKEFYRIEYFTAKENAPLIEENILKSFRCQE